VWAGQGLAGGLAGQRPIGPRRPAGCGICIAARRGRLRVIVRPRNNGASVIVARQ